MQNFYWLTGDRTLCLLRKDNIISETQKLGNYVVKNISNLDSADSICSSFGQNSLFGQESYICIYDGTLPDLDKMIDVLGNENCPVIFILLEDKINKKSAFYKKNKEILEEMPFYIEGEYDKWKKIAEISRIIKGISGWDGEDRVFEHIFSSCQYDIGMTMSEIEKCKTYNDGKYPRKIEDIQEILHTDKISRWDVYFLLDKGSIVERLETASVISKEPDFEVNFISTISQILSNKNFQLNCKIAETICGQDTDKIGECLLGMEKKGDANSLLGRYERSKESLKSKTVEGISRSIDEIGRILEYAIQNAPLNYSYLLKRLVSISYSFD